MVYGKSSDGKVSPMLQQPLLEAEVAASFLDAVKNQNHMPKFQIVEQSIRPFWKRASLGYFQTLLFTFHAY